MDAITKYKHNAKQTLKKWTEGEREGFQLGSLKSKDLQESTALFMETIQTQDMFGNALLEEDSDVSTTHLGADSAAGNSASYGIGGLLDGTASQQAYQYRPISLALARRVYPSLFAHKLVGVQAMGAPVGYAFAMRTIYANSVASASDKGIEAGWDDVATHSGYSGGYVEAGGTNSGTIDGTVGQAGDIGTQGDTGTEADQGLGAHTTDAENWAIGGTGETEWPELTIKMDKKSIEANTRKLGASFTTESMQDIRAMHNIDLGQELINKLQYEVTAELDREILKALKLTSLDTANGGAVAGNVDVSSIEDMRERSALVINSIMYASTVVAQKAKKGRANFVVVSGDVASVLQSARSVFTANTALVDPGIVLSGGQSTEIGTLNNSITVYLDNYAGSTSYALIGFKGAGVSDAGVIFSPYIMNVVKSAQTEDSFNSRLGVMSRYAVTTGLLSAGSYYRYITFTGLSDNIGLDTTLEGWY
jgi:hypothetical protein